MNHRQARQLFSDYRSQTPVPEEFLAVRRKARWPLITASSAIVITVLAIAFWPRESLAAALERVNNAITNVESMEAKVYRRRMGTDRHIATYTYRSGAWRYDSFLGSALETTTILRDGLMVSNTAAFPYSTVGKPFARESLPPKTALEYVLDSIDAGQTNIEREMNLVSSRPQDGRPTYTIVATRPGYRAVILIEKDTDLPITASVDVDYGGGDQDHLSWVYKWNLQLAESYFTAEDFGLPIIDRDKEVAELKRNWQVPIATVNIGAAKSNLRNVFVAQNGCVFLAYTHHKDKTGLAPVPSRMTDDVGNIYVRASEYSPGGVYGEVPTREDMALDGGEMRIAVFTPIETGTFAGHFDIHWRLGRSTWPASSDNDPMFEGKVATMTITAPARSNLEFPPYSAALVVDGYHLQKRIEIAHIRAQGLLDRRMFKEAVDAAWIAYNSYKFFIPRIAYNELPIIVEALKALGRVDEANEVQARYREEKEYDDRFRAS